jgi:hypothetical protein
MSKESNYNTYRGLEEAYKEPKEFLGNTLCEFSDTTNQAFKDRIQKAGYVSFTNHCVAFTSTRDYGSMRTSYVIRLTYNKANRVLLVHTRNSVYKFQVESNFEKDDFTWSLDEQLRLNYEGIIRQAEKEYYGL